MNFWKTLNNEIPKPNIPLIAMRVDCDVIEDFNFGEKFHMGYSSWDEAVKDSFRRSNVTHWVYTKEIMPLSTNK